MSTFRFDLGATLLFSLHDHFKNYQQHSPGSGVGPRGGRNNAGPGTQHHTTQQPSPGSGVGPRGGRNNAGPRTLHHTTQQHLPGSGVGPRGGRYNAGPRTLHHTTQQLSEKKTRKCPSHVNEDFLSQDSQNLGSPCVLLILCVKHE